MHVFLLFMYLDELFDHAYLIAHFSIFDTGVGTFRSSQPLVLIEAKVFVNPRPA